MKETAKATWLVVDFGLQVSAVANEHSCFLSGRLEKAPQFTTMPMRTAL